VFPCLAL